MALCDIDHTDFESRAVRIWKKRRKVCVSERLTVAGGNIKG
jgi:hypothetical protein